MLTTPTVFDSQLIARVESNFKDFHALVDRARDYAQSGHEAAAAAFCQIAAHYAAQNPPGLFASRKLETIAVGIGRNLAGARFKNTVAASRAQFPTRVLHVLTQAYGLGGHTRAVWRWIENDRERQHSVVLTSQQNFPIPFSLAKAVESSGGRILRLDNRLGDLIGRARRLRAYGAGADVIVLHAHPYDIVPTLAFADKEGIPPIILYNHADHLFWVGVTVSDVVAHFRESGRALSRKQRGIDGARCSLLPLPLHPVQRELSRAEAKQKLGKSGETIVLVSIARGYKYTPVAGFNMLRAAGKALRHANAVLFIVGLDRNTPWLHEIGEGREKIEVVGRSEDTSFFYQAADIYLDSFPFASLTSVLEAGGYGAPAVSYCPHLQEAPIMCCDDPALTDSVSRATTEEEYATLLSALMEGPALRQRLGDQALEAIREVHTQLGWRKSLESLYAVAINPISCCTIPQADERSPGTTDYWLASLFGACGVSCGADRLVRENIGLLPAGLRWKLWREEIRSQRPLPVRSLLSEGFRLQVRSYLRPKANQAR